MQNQNFNNTNKTHSYWLELHKFYSSKSTMMVTLVDETGKVMITIAPALDPNNTSRPQAGVAAYNYEAATKFRLDLFEIQAIILAYRTNIVNNENLQFYHQNGNTGSTFSFFVYNNYYGISIGDNKFIFSNTKLNSRSNNYVSANLELFMTTLQSVLDNIVLIKSKLIPEKVSSNQGYQSNSQQQSFQPNNFNNNYQNNQSHNQNRPNNINNSYNSNTPNTNQQFNNKQQTNVSNNNFNYDSMSPDDEF